MRDSVLSGGIMEKVARISSSRERPMSPGSLQARLENQVYCFRTLPKDQRVGNLPTHSGFFAYLAGQLMQKGSQDIMLNVPETIIVRNEANMHLGEKMSPKKSKSPSRSQKKSPKAKNFKNHDDTTDPYEKHFFLLSNHGVAPSQGNLPSLPLVQKLQVKRHTDFKDAKAVFSHWLRDLNIKKIKQHAEQRQGQEVYLPLCVSKRHAEGKGNI